MTGRTPLQKHLELEAMFGADFLPAPRTDVARKPDEEVPAEFAAFRSKVLECRKCGLCETRKQVVFGVGSLKSPLVFVGEAPGAYEDAKGEPFVGRAGQLLTKTLASIGVRRDQVYIANILKCRPPDNRTPQPAEMEACMPWLHEQLKWINPRLICALGNVAVQGLLGTKIGITKLRGRPHDFAGRKLYPVYHPAYVLRNMGEIRTFEGDLRHVCTEAGLIAAK